MHLHELSSFFVPFKHGVSVAFAWQLLNLHCTHSCSFEYQCMGHSQSVASALAVMFGSMQFEHWVEALVLATVAFGQRAHAVAFKSPLKVPGSHCLHVVAELSLE